MRVFKPNNYGACV